MMSTVRSSALEYQSDSLSMHTICENPNAPRLDGAARFDRYTRIDANHAVLNVHHLC